MGDGMKLGSSSRRRLMMSACIVLAVFAFVATTTWLDGAHRLYTAPWSQAAWRAAGNALPGLLLAWLLLALTRRLLLAFGIAFVVETIVYTLSHLKEKYLDVPLLPNDFYML